MTDFVDSSLFKIKRKEVRLKKNLCFLNLHLYFLWLRKEELSLRIVKFGYLPTNYSMDYLIREILKDGEKV